MVAVSINAAMFAGTALGTREVTCNKLVRSSVPRCVFGGRMAQSWCMEASVPETSLLRVALNGAMDAEFTLSDCGATG
jgi:hypothetical protein